MADLSGAFKPADVATASDAASDALSKIAIVSDAASDALSDAASKVATVSDAASKAMSRATNALSTASDAKSSASDALSKIAGLSDVVSKLTVSVASDITSAASDAVSKAKSDAGSKVAVVSDAASKAMSRATNALSQASDAKSAASDALSKIAIISDAASDALSKIAIVSDAASDALSKIAIVSDAASNAQSKITARSAAWDKKVVILKIYNEVSAIATGDGKMYFAVPAALNGMNLVSCGGHLYTAATSGVVAVQIYNVNSAVDMLSRAMEWDATEKDTSTGAASSLAKINTANDNILTGEEVRIDIDAAGSGAKGMEVRLTFQLP